MPTRENDSNLDPTLIEKISSDSSDTRDSSSARESRSAKGNHRRTLGIALLLVFVAVIGWQFRGYLSLDFLIEQEQFLREYHGRYPWFVALLGLALYALVTGISIPGALLMTLLYGWLFGFWAGVLIVSFGSTGGATLAFLSSRYLLRDWVESRLGPTVQRILKHFDSEGAYYLFTLRLIPAVPFFVINVVMGLTRLSPLTFWWVSQLGMLPATLVYVFAGSSLPGLKQIRDEGTSSILSWQILVAFLLLGFLPLAIKKSLHRFQPQKVANDSPN